MVADWLLPVAAAGGSALVGAVATDAWQSTRSGVMRLFGRAGERRAELAGDWADQTATAITAAPVEELAAVRLRSAEAWQRRLADLVDEYPELNEALRAWAEETQRELSVAGRTWVNTFVARDQATMYNAPGGSITVTHAPVDPPAS
ncbi:hypothetical protein I0C86_27950 [Plantactinospora sp. S1510]|uniref:Uncharacterized protein n=1 Tax=Plantactinospora alkalitolerans TaxID=2789879 RepID=A0ABS0H2S9_9ACTN|nr:hypothetical protein [Plantactinospora alkalitolerans]MBF9132760.1 hypothetical protein [Plantactinospora alkalitolerans]